MEKSLKIKGLDKSLDYYFSEESHNTDAPIKMYEWDDELKKRVYLVNKYGKKLIQIVVKDEVHKEEQYRYAQINLIPYSCRYFIVYDNKKTSPKKERIIGNFKFTYHGSKSTLDNPKIHIKLSAGSNHGYRTINDSVITLEDNTPRLIPIFSFFPGFLVSKNIMDNIEKSAHILRLKDIKTIRFDFYFSGKGFDLSSYFQSFHSYNMFFTPEYLISNYRHPLVSSTIICPIKGYCVSEYYLWIKMSNYKFNGRPFFQFYNNIEYYQNFLNRKVAHEDKDGNFVWSTGLDEERRISKQQG